MITENGSIKTEMTSYEKAWRQYTKGSFTVAVICLALGSVGVGVYLTFDILSVFNITEEPMTWILILVAVPFAFGLIFTLIHKKQYRDLRETEQSAKSTYEFFSDYFTYVTEGEGVTVPDGKSNELGASGVNVVSERIDYRQIIKHKETKDFLFVTTDMKNIIFIDKNPLLEREVSTLRKLFWFPVDEDECLSLPSGDGNNREITEE